MTLSRPTVYRALRQASSMAAAADTLDMSIQDLRALAYRMHLFGAVYRLERAADEHHPGFVDMAGKVLFDGAITVVDREDNTPNGNARWRVRYRACGHTEVHQGIALRDKRVAPRCRQCKEARR